MGELLSSLLEGMFQALPSKKNRMINRKFALLRKESWYKDKYSPLAPMNGSVRALVNQSDIEKLIKGGF